jgi:hypothetical protein
MILSLPSPTMPHPFAKQMVNSPSIVSSRFMPHSLLLTLK